MTKKFSTLPTSQKAEHIQSWMREHKARDISAFDLAGHSPLTDMTIVASASSTRHARSLADGIMELCTKEQYEFLRMEGYQAGLWILADLNDIIVHIFMEDMRELYNLESLWRDAVALPAPGTPQ